MQHILQLLGFEHKQCLEALNELATSCRIGDVDILAIVTDENLKNACVVGSPLS